MSVIMFSCLVIVWARRAVVFGLPLLLGFRLFAFGLLAFTAFPLLPLFFFTVGLVLRCPLPLFLWFRCFPKKRCKAVTAVVQYMCIWRAKELSSLEIDVGKGTLLFREILTFHFLILGGLAAEANATSHFWVSCLFVSEDLHLKTSTRL